MPISAPSNLFQLAGGYLKPLRSIGNIVPDVVIEEAHNDVVQVTEHPVEKGAEINDHAFKRPAELIIFCGWSQSSPSNSNLLIANPIGEFISGPEYIKEAYKTLLSYQAAREPLEVFTGKRTYSNMLIVGLTTVTDRRSEYILAVYVRLREVIIVETSATTIPPKAQQALPQATQPPANAGSKTAVTP